MSNYKGLFTFDIDNHRYVPVEQLGDIITDINYQSEEAKGYYNIAEMCGGIQKKQDTDDSEDRFNKEIGNYLIDESRLKRLSK